jgi:hypothetical protein
MHATSTLLGPEDQILMVITKEDFQAYWKVKGKNFIFFVGPMLRSLQGYHVQGYAK